MTSTDDDPNHLAAQAWSSIVHIFRSDEATQMFRRAAEVERLTPRQLSVLMALPDEGGIPMAHLAENCHTSPSHITQVVNTLQQHGLVTRTVDSADRRIKQASLTHQGQHTVHRAHQRMSTPPAGLTALDHDALRQLRDLLAKASHPYQP